jgi:hypothetical protein
MSNYDYAVICQYILDYGEIEAREYYGDEIVDYALTFLRRFV